MAYPSRMRVALKFSPLARTTYRRMRPWASASSLAGSRSSREVGPCGAASVTYDQSR